MGIISIGLILLFKCVILLNHVAYVGALKSIKKQPPRFMVGLLCESFQ